MASLPLAEAEHMLAAAKAKVLEMGAPRSKMKMQPGPGSKRLDYRPQPKTVRLP